MGGTLAALKPAPEAASAYPSPLLGFPYDLLVKSRVRSQADGRAGPPGRGPADVAEGDRGGRGAAAVVPGARGGFAQAGRPRRLESRRARRLPARATRRGDRDGRGGARTRGLDRADGVL